jgi:hypothetical protein
LYDEDDIVVCDVLFAVVTMDPEDGGNIFFRNLGNAY